MLASGSADHTVRLWDIGSVKCLRTYTHHTDKAQVVRWNPRETTVLLTGSFDQRVAIFDTRTPKQTQLYSLGADIEQAQWNPHDPTYFLASNEDGIVTCFDMRLIDRRSLFTLKAHDKPVSALDFNPAARDIILTGSTDKSLKIWDLNNHKPSLVLSRDMGVVSLEVHSSNHEGRPLSTHDFFS